MNILYMVSHVRSGKQKAKGELRRGDFACAFASNQRLRPDTNVSVFLFIYFQNWILFIYLFIFSGF